MAVPAPHARSALELHTDGAGRLGWEAKNLDLLKPEPEAPELSTQAPWLGVSFYPAQGGATEKAVRTWTDLSKWRCRFTETQADGNARMQAKSRN